MNRADAVRRRRGREALLALRAARASAPTPAAQHGIELHRRIEEHGGGSAAAAAAEVEEPYDLDPGERRGGGSAVSAEQMWENFLASRFARMAPLRSEQPFTLYLGAGLSVTGRIDAIFERAGGTWEVVDYKSGTSEPDPYQLAIYRRAVEQIWGRPVRASWLLLRDGREESYDGEGFEEVVEGVRRLQAWTAELNR